MGSSACLANACAPPGAHSTLTGNFCMPRCDEPWVESLYSGPGGSKARHCSAAGGAAVGSAAPAASRVAQGCLLTAAASACHHCARACAPPLQIQLWVLYSFRLTSKAQPSLADIGSPRSTIDKARRWLGGAAAAG